MLICWWLPQVFFISYLSKTKKWSQCTNAQVFNKNTFYCDCHSFLEFVGEFLENIKQVNKPPVIDAIII